MSLFRRRLLMAAAMAQPPKPIGYIMFEDPEVQRICIANFSSDGVGVTYNDAEKVSDVGITFKSTKIKKFNEFVYFSSIKVLHQAAFQFSTVEEIKLPNGLEELGFAAFGDTDKLIKIEIGENLKAMSAWVFSGQKNIKTFVIRTIIPPGIGSNSFGNLKFPQCSFFVPDQSVETYKKARYWSIFADNIKPLSSYVEPKIDYETVQKRRCN